MARITSRFGAFTDALDVTAGVDLSGKRAIVTGGNSGIGVETVRALAHAGAEVVIAARAPSSAARVQAEINDLGRGRVHVAPLDLADLSSVRAFAALEADKPLHILINNAGVMACPQGYTKDGFEMQIGVNHFGHFLLAALLAPALAKGAPSRVVALSSIGHRRSPILWDDMHFRSRPYDKWESYGQSKTANALFAVELARRWKDRGITAFSVMPGGIMTNLQRHLPKEEQMAMGWIDAEGKLTRSDFKSASQGASTSVWAAVGAELEGAGGLYLENCAEAEPWSKETPWAGVMAHAQDPDEAARLWALSEESVGV